MSTGSVQATRELLREHFQTDPNSPKRWDDLWKDGIVPWDRAKPNPALFDILRSRKNLIGEAVTEVAGNEKRRKKAFVPGCGRGYDVMLLASFGYDAIGLDGSETAIAECKKLEATDGDKYPLQEGVDEKGNVDFVLGDFFKDDWTAAYNILEGDGGFDLIYDYTVDNRLFYCTEGKALMAIFSFYLPFRLRLVPNGLSEWSTFSPRQVG
jgi:hypothetical protein